MKKLTLREFIGGINMKLDNVLNTKTKIYLSFKNQSTVEYSYSYIPSKYINGTRDDPPSAFEKDVDGETDVELDLWLYGVTKHGSNVIFELDFSDYEDATEIVHPTHEIDPDNLWSDILSVLQSDTFTGDEHVQFRLNKEIIDFEVRDVRDIARVYSKYNSYVTVEIPGASNYFNFDLPEKVYNDEADRAAEQASEHAEDPDDDWLGGDGEDD